MAYVMNFTHLGDDQQNGKTLLTARVEVDSSVHMEHIAEVLEVGVEEIRAYNEHFIQQVVPQTGRNEIVLPYQLAMRYLEKEEEVFRLAREKALLQPVYEKKNITVYHKVRSGETISTIARKHSVTIAQIRAWNRLSSKKPVYAGQRLVIHKIQWVKTQPVGASAAQ
jgi:membrane-bound lytic murein transglycosylase D